MCKPMGNRVWKSATVDGVTTTHKYIVDISGQLPTILCITDASDPNLLISSYTYAGAQVLAQRQYPVPTDPNVYDAQFYVHDRLGSVRLVVDYNDIDACVSVANSYTYTPFGSHYDGEAPAETVENPFKFTGQWYDTEINQYYLRARMYDPTMMRFTSRDPLKGEQNEPLTLHKYLYTANDPLNKTDLTGKAYDQIVGAITAGAQVYNESLRTMAYSVASGNDKFFELGLDMYSFTPYAMALGTTGYTPNVAANITAIFVGTGLTSQTTKYLMDPLGSHATPFLAQMAFTLWTEGCIWLNGITDEEMDDFNNWNHPIAVDYWK